MKPKRARSGRGAVFKITIENGDYTLFFVPTAKIILRNNKTNKCVLFHTFFQKNGNRRIKFMKDTIIYSHLRNRGFITVNEIYRIAFKFEVENMNSEIATKSIAELDKEGVFEEREIIGRKGEKV